MSIFHVGDIAIFNPDYTDTDPHYRGKKCKIISDYQVEMLERVYNCSRHLLHDIGERVGATADQLIPAEPPKPYTTNTLGDFPKKEL